MSIQISLLEDQFIDMAFITQLTQLTDKWFYKLIKDGKFPKPTKFGRSSRWRKSEVEAATGENRRITQLDTSPYISLS